MGAVFIFTLDKTLKIRYYKIIEIKSLDDRFFDSIILKMIKNTLETNEIKENKRVRRIYRK